MLRTLVALVLLLLTICSMIPSFCTCLLYTNKRNRTEASYSRPLACLAPDWLRNAKAMRKVGSWSTLRKAALRTGNSSLAGSSALARLRRCDHCGWPLRNRARMSGERDTYFWEKNKNILSGWGEGEVMISQWARFFSLRPSLREFDEAYLHGIVTAPN